MLNRVFLGLALGTLALMAVGCARDAAPTDVASPSKQSSGFAIIEFTREGGQQPDFFCLEAKYGYIVDWKGPDGHAFYLFDRPRQKRFMTHDWTRFLEEVRRLPDGIEIQPVNKCGAPFEYGMPEKQLAVLDQALKAKKIRRVSADDPDKMTACFCELKAYRVLHDADAPTPPQPVTP
ncbi:MAG: hypothetical protein NTW19_06725 [Planctomycetota bacterium]|nr:hypothetical protein [Planctomycetota bacterium]